MLDLRHRPELIWIAAYAVVLNLIVAGGHVHLSGEHGHHLELIVQSASPYGRPVHPRDAEEDECLDCWSQAQGASLLLPEASASFAADYSRQWRSAPVTRIAELFDATAFHARAPPLRQFNTSHMS